MSVFVLSIPLVLSIKHMAFGVLVCFHVRKKTVAFYLLETEKDAHKRVFAMIAKI